MARSRIYPPVRAVGTKVIISQAPEARPLFPYSWHSHSLTVLLCIIPLRLCVSRYALLIILLPFTKLRPSRRVDARLVIFFPFIISSSFEGINRPQRIFRQNSSVRYTAAPKNANPPTQLTVSAARLQPPETQNLLHLTQQHRPTRRAGTLRHIQE